MPRASNTHSTPPADAPLVDACRAFLGAAAALDEFSETGQGDGAAITRRYCRTLADLARAMPKTAGALTGRAVAAHLATRTARRIVPREAQAALMAEARP